MKLSISLVSALVEQGMFYWFGGELLEEVRVFCIGSSQVQPLADFIMNTKI
jgi:hypothetical protein